MAERYREELFYSYPIVGIYDLGGQAITSTYRTEIHRNTDNLLLAPENESNQAPFITMPDFSIPAELWRASSTGAVVEVGGYSSRGYQSLKAGAFASPCIITNVRCDATTANCPTPLQPPQTSEVDNYLYADGRQLPFSDNSLGVMLSSALPLFTPDTQPDGCVVAAFAALGDQLTADRLTATQRQSPRLGTMIEARRSLKAGGLLVMRWSITHTELNAARKLGFTLKAHTSPRQSTVICATACTRLHERYGPNEVIFQKEA